jgi:hypothetical protein
MPTKIYHVDHRLHRESYNSARRKRSALEMTETELKVIAALAIMGLSKRPKNG